jgi:hypothetical protein
VPKPQGYAFESEEKVGTLTKILHDGGITHALPGREWDTFTCNHCQNVVRYQKRAAAYDMGGYCTICSSMICQHCVGKGCKPFEERLRKMERLHEMERAGDRKREF